MTRNSLDAGRASFLQRSWGEAYTRLTLADADESLELDDLENLGMAAYLSGHDDASTDVWSRAHGQAIGSDDVQRAARHALLIGSGLLFRGEIGPAMGWFARGGRVLEGSDDCPEQGWLSTWNAYAQMFGGDPDGAIPAFVAGIASGQRFGDTELVTMSRLGHGMSLVMRGEGAKGIPLFDEVMVAVTSGEISPNLAGIAYCSVIAACSDLFDVRRAREWTAELTRWCDAQPDLVPYRGNCLVHRCELMQLQGEWTDAMEVAEEACEHLSGPISWDTLGSAHYQLGELRRLRGELALAEESYRSASGAGREPEPGLALLRLAQGSIDAAAAMIRRVMDEAEDPSARSRLLPAFVEIMIAADDAPSARAGADELDQIAQLLDAPYLRAVAANAAGAVLMAEGDARSALPKLREAGSTWRELDAPHENARVCVLVGQACAMLGDLETSAMEVEAARAAFEKLGAGLDIARLEALAVRQPRKAAHGLTDREVQVLRLVASGATNRAIAKELGLSEKTVARHVSNVFTKIGVPSRAAATAYAYENGLVRGG